MVIFAETKVHSMERFSDEQLNNISLPLLQWYYEQADRNHRDLVQTSRDITGRGYTLLAVYYAILAAAAGYIITHLHQTDDTALTAGCLSVVVFCCIAIGYIMQVVWPHPFYPAGKTPDDFKILEYQYYFKGKMILGGELQFKNVLADELLSVQYRIDYMAKQNKCRLKYLKTSVLFLTFGAALAVALFILCLWLP